MNPGPQIELGIPPNINQARSKLLRVASKPDKLTDVFIVVVLQIFAYIENGKSRVTRLTHHIILIYVCPPSQMNNWLRRKWGASTKKRKSTF